MVKRLSREPEAGTLTTKWLRSLTSYNEDSIFQPFLAVSSSYWTALKTGSICSQVEEAAGNMGRNRSQEPTKKPLSRAGLSTSALETFGAASFFVVGVRLCTAGCRKLSSFLDLYPRDASSISHLWQAKMSLSNVPQREGCTQSPRLIITGLESVQPLISNGIWRLSENFMSQRP